MDRLGTCIVGLAHVAALAGCGGATKPATPPTPVPVASAATPAPAPAPPTPDAAASCDAGDANACRTEGATRIAAARRNPASPGQLEQAYGLLERACALRQLSDQVLGHRDPVYNPNTPEDDAERRAAMEFGMSGRADTGPTGVPPETAELVAYLKSKRTEYAGCLRRFAYLAEAGVAAPSLPPPAGTVRFGAPSAVKVSADQVLEAVGALKERFRSCFAMGLRRNPALSGRITLRFSFVDASGEPFSVQSAGSDIADRSVIDCVALAAYDVRMTPGSQGAATVPMVFVP